MLTSTVNVRLGAAAAVALLVAGCNTDSTPPTPAVPSSAASSSSGSTAARTDFNDADVAFLEAMYPHHDQAVEMVKLVPTRSQNMQVLNLASRIGRVQDHEIGQISGLLRTFGISAPAPADAGSMGDMPGMMSADQMDSLEGLSGSDFDRMWLSMMIDHHNGAIDMANTELTNGVNPEAHSLAQNIIASQQPEITQMRSMLG